ncbi:MAG: hypothetical protein M0Z42_04075 [Actinomycetota bacterium]|nr:hypothetical protein [Actinomycetota bacterium]
MYGINRNECTKTLGIRTDVDDGLKRGPTSTEQDEVVQLRRDNRRLVMEREILRRAAAYFAKDAPKMKFPLVRELANEGLSVSLTCRVLGLARESFYESDVTPFSKRAWQDAHLANELFDLHRDDPPFGYRFLADKLKDRGHAVGENRATGSARSTRSGRRPRRRTGRSPARLPDRLCLSMNGLAGSMGRVASVADNTAMETFHSLLQKNVLDQRRVWESREQLYLAIITRIEHTYNNRRRQRRLDKLTPVELEQAFAVTQAA